MTFILSIISSHVPSYVTRFFPKTRPSKHLLQRCYLSSVNINFRLLPLKVWCFLKWTIGLHGLMPFPFFFKNKVNLKEHNYPFLEIILLWISFAIFIFTDCPQLTCFCQLKKLFHIFNTERCVVSWLRGVNLHDDKSAPFF